MARNEDKLAHSQRTETRGDFWPNTCCFASPQQICFASLYQQLHGCCNKKELQAQKDVELTFKALSHESLQRR